MKNIRRTPEMLRVVVQGSGFRVLVWGMGCRVGGRGGGGEKFDRGLGSRALPSGWLKGSRDNRNTLLSSSLWGSGFRVSG